MHIRITLALALALALAANALLPLTSQAQETFTIKIKKVGKGEAIHYEKNSTEVEDIKVADNNGTVLKNDVKNTVLAATYDQTILEKPDPKKKATVLKRSYQKATAKVDDDAKVLPFQGKTVIIEKKGDKFAFRYEGGGDITGDDAKWLDKEFNNEKEDSDFDLESKLLPAKAVAVGESWKIDMADIVKEFTKAGKMDADAAAAKGTGKLLKASKKDGRQYGDLQFKLEIPIKSVSAVGNTIPMQPGAKMVMEVTVSGCIDGSEVSNKSKLGLNFSGIALIPADNPQVRLTVSVRSNADELETELAKKK